MKVLSLVISSLTLILLVGCSSKHQGPGKKQDPKVAAQLIEAASKGDVETTKSILDRGFDPNVRDENSSTPLHLAVRLRVSASYSFGFQGENLKAQSSVKQTGEDNHLAVAKLLVKQGADVNARDRKGRTPLMDASSAAVALLLDSGADANARDDDGNTALHRAARSLEFAALDEQLFLIQANDFIQVSQHLLGKGSDINAKNAEGETPLDIVVGSFLGTRYTREVIEKALPHVKFLLSAGAKYNKLLDKQSHGTVSPRHQLERIFGK